MILHTNTSRFTNDKRLRIIFSAIPVIVLCITIFCLSAQKGSDSDNTSSTVVAFLPASLCEYLAVKFRTDTSTVSAIIEVILRKTAHFCEFALLAVLTSVHFSTFMKKRYFLYAFLFSSIYAASDEFHQLFVDGRSAEFRDIAIDSCGALTAVLVFVLLRFCYRKIKTKKN